MRNESTSAVLFLGCVRFAISTDARRHDPLVDDD